MINHREVEIQTRQLEGKEIEMQHAWISTKQNKTKQNKNKTSEKK